MKAGIIGAGALGSLFSYYFSRAGIDYTVYEINHDLVDAISKGLYIDSGEGKEKIFPVIDSNPQILKDSDILFIFVKSYATSDAVRQIKPHINKNSVIVSLQNGIGNFESICEHVESDRIVYGITTHGASKESPGTLRLGGYGTIEFGGSSEDSVKKICYLLEKAALDFEITGTPEKSVWQKALINAGINPIAAIMNITNGEIIKSSYLKKLQENIIIEGTAAAEYAGIHIDAKEIISRTIDVCIKTSMNRCSMLQDITSRRKTEIDHINGKIIEYAAKGSITVPFNESLYYMIKAAEECCCKSL